MNWVEKVVEMEFFCVARAFADSIALLTADHKASSAIKRE